MLNGLSRGHFITTGVVSSTARRYAEQGGVTVIDGDAVRDLLLVHARELC